MRLRQHSPLTDKGQAKTREFFFFFFWKQTKEVYLNIEEYDVPSQQSRDFKDNHIIKKLKILVLVWIQNNKSQLVCICIHVCILVSRNFTSVTGEKLNSLSTPDFMGFLKSKSEIGSSQQSSKFKA